MKKVTFVLVFMLVMALATGVFANQDIKVEIDGKIHSFVQAPVVINDRTLVPMRGIFEILGAEIEWDNDTKTVTATKGKRELIIQIGSKTALIDGEEVTLEVEARIVKSSTMVPLRFVSEALGGEVGWDAKTKTALITSVEAKVKSNPNAYLREAMKTRNYDGVKIALKAGADNSFEMMYVFLDNDLELLKLFLEFGFDINQDFGAPENSMTFTFDTNKFNDEFAIFALENGLKVTNNTLYKAIARNSLNVTRYLLENKLVDPNISPTFMTGKHNAYLYAISWGYHDIAQLLLQYGAKTSVD